MPDQTQPNQTPLPPVITPEQARSGEYVFCDVRWYLDGRSGHDAYLAGHIPGAIFVDLDKDLADPPSTEHGRHPLPSAQQFSQSLGELGLAPDDVVVAYDDTGGQSAGRLVWMLRVLGTQAALLDGGLPAWDGPLSTTPVERPRIDVPVRDWPAELLADAAFTGSQAQTATAVVADTRNPERYRGEVEPVDTRPGHIPGAINLSWDGNLDSQGRFLSKEALRERFESAGISADDGQETIMYCGSGVSACHNLLAMEYAGFGTGTKLYPGSWSQWSARPELPAELGDPS